MFGLPLKFIPVGICRKPNNRAFKTEKA